MAVNSPSAAELSAEEKQRRLAEAAERALAEAAERRAQADDQAKEQTPAPTELGGRDGPEPTRYGDWEKKGLAVDF